MSVICVIKIKVMWCVVEFGFDGECYVCKCCDMVANLKCKVCVCL